MNKKEAAEYLGISLRQVENYAKKGELSVSYQRGKTGDVAVFNDEELRRLKAKIESQRAPRPSVVRESPERLESTALATSRISDFGELLDWLAGARAEKLKAAISDIALKPLLKLEEAAALTGLSTKILRKAIDTNDLKAKKIGRSFRIKRPDLDEYIKQL